MTDYENLDLEKLDELGYTEFKVHSSILEPISAFYKDDPVRVFFEYIDNSLDSAERHGFYDEKNNSYKKEILINFDIDTKTKEVTITDNCNGIKDLDKLLKSIGRHDKYGDTDHGQFGFGVFSFPAVANRIRITTKYVEKSVGEMVEFTPEDMDKGFTRKPQKVSYFWDNGTEIRISEFKEKKFFKSLPDIIKGRLESHLEGILQRKNLRIEITTNKSNNSLCVPYDYDQYAGEVFEKTIDTPVNKPIKVYLKVIENKQINRPPFFMVKGREIKSISEMSNFKSKNKGNIRRHPNLIGYIDLGNTVNPKLSRDELQLDKSTKWVFNKIIELEPEVDELIQRVNKITQNEHYKKFENILTDIVAERMKLDNMKYNMMNSVSGTGGSSAGGEETNVSGIKGEEGFGAQDHNDGRTNDSEDTRSFGTGEGDGIGPNGNPGQDFPSDEKDETGKHKGIIDGDFGGMKTKSKPSFGFPIKFEDVEVPEDEMHRKIRSSLIGGEIIIYKNHPDYIERTKTFANGNDKITQRLITYLAGEITVHIKDSFHNHHTQPWANKDMFIDLVDTIYWFEDRLKGLVDKNLSDLS